MSEVARAGLPAGLRDALRRGTADAHGALDLLWNGSDLADRADYVRFLRASATALLPIEAGLAAAGAAGLLPDWAHRQRTDAITADLVGLGIAPPASDRGAAWIASGPAMFGAFYVLEGSRLGGVLLLRQAQASGDDAVRANLRYLRHGQGGGLWRSFLQRLDALDPSPAEVAGMIAQARDAFASFDAAARAAVTPTGRSADA